MKHVIKIIVLFIVTYTAFYGIGSFLFDGEAQPNTLQAAVTFNGINFLALFIYFILATIATTVLFFTTKEKSQ